MSEPLDVSETLNRAKGKFKAATVEKEDDLAYDLGNLFAYDIHPVNTSEYNSNKEQYLIESARENTQLLITHIFQLPTKRTDTGVLATLPRPQIALPREKHVPQPKPETKWEQFAKRKGIQKRKRDKMVWDEDFGEWRPRYGYKKANNPLDKDNWVIEYKGNDTGEVDPFTRLETEKKERVKKQRKAEMRNRGKAAKSQNKPYARAFHTDLDDVDPGDARRKRRKTELGDDMAKTQISTASHGLFQERLKGDKPVKVKQKTKKYSATENMANEKKESLTVIDRILRKDEGKLNVGRAVKQHNRRLSGRTND